MTDWNPGRGGAEAYTAWLRDGLKAAGDEVRLLTSSAGTAGDGTAEYVAYGTASKAPQTVLQIVNPLAAATVRRAVRQYRPDVVWINNFAYHLSPAAALAVGGLPKVLMVSDYKSICPLGSRLRPDGSLCGTPAGWVCHQSGCLSLPHWLRDQPRYALIRMALRRMSRILACSRWLQRELASSGIASDVLAAPVPAPPLGYARAAAPVPTFLFCARLGVEKGAELLLRAFARLAAEFPTARLRLVGQGPKRLALESLAESLGIGPGVAFLGWRPPDELEPLYSEAWALVVPSLWAEPQGLVPLHAIVRRVPVIASSAGGLGEMVEHGVSGLVFWNNDEDALLDRLRQIASGSAFPQRDLPEAVADRVAEEFGVERHVATIRQIFAETIEAGTTGSSSPADTCTPRRPRREIPGPRGP
jgi:glycosyltransferase involved in cell wall biosynthesis